MEKIIQSLCAEIEMPKKVIVGDPDYFERYPNRKDLVYNKSFRGKDNWVGYIELKETEGEFKIGDEAHKTTNYDMKTIFAPNEVLLKLYKNNQRFSIQKEKVTEIGVDSASYFIQINDNSDTIRTGGDGLWGHIIEYSASSKLNGFIIDMGLPDLNNFEENKRIVEYLFDCKLK